MMNTSLLVKAGAVLALTAGFAAAAQAGVPSPLNYGTSNGTPGNAFETGGALLQLSASGSNYNFTLSGSLGSNAALTFPGYSNYSITGATITLSGTLTKSGGSWVLAGPGTETITGSIAACSSNCGSLSTGWSAGSGTLYSAKLSSLKAYTGSGGYDYLGFNTSFAGTSSWMLNNNINGGSQNESTYLYAVTSTALSTAVQNNSYFDAFVNALATGAALSSGTVNAYIGSYSTVPLPMSGLLLGGGLLGLGVFARRREAIA